MATPIPIPQMALFLGIIPALLILWIGLRGYEGLYKDKNIFLMFIVGIILGFVIALIELFTAGVGIIYILLFPVLEQMSKVIILNIGRFQEKRETVIYGLCLGLGFGSIFTPASLLAIPTSVPDIFTMVLIVIGTIGIIFFQGAAGALIGYGIYRGQLMKYIVLAVLLEIPITGSVFIFEYLQRSYLQSLIVVYGILVFWYVAKYVMPGILEDTERRKRTFKEEKKKTKA
jgi:hypothetical protein